MTGLVIAIHVFACVLLIVIILIQRGRGGGLVESLSGVESMFGTNTNAFLSRLTTILSIVFFFTCLSLAFLAAKQGKSLIGDTKAKQGVVKEEAQPQAQAAVKEKAETEPSPVAQVPPQSPQSKEGAPTTQP